MAAIFSGQSSAMFFQYTTSITKARTSMNYIFALRRKRELNDTDDSGSDGNNEETMSEKGTAVEIDDIGFAYPLRPR